MFIAEFITAGDKFMSEIEIATWAILTYMHLVPGMGN